MSVFFSYIVSCAYHVPAEGPTLCTQGSPNQSHWVISIHAKHKDVKLVDMKEGSESRRERIEE